MYFDDLPVGYTFETTSKEVHLKDILEFAQKWDPQPFHTDEQAAVASPYGGIIASGFQTLLIAFNLTLEADIWSEASMGSPGMTDIEWKQPVRPGDRLRCLGEVLKSTPSSSRGDRGRTVIKSRVLNQAGAVVAQYTSTHILQRAAQTGEQGG